MRILAMTIPCVGDRSYPESGLQIERLARGMRNRKRGRGRLFVDREIRAEGLFTEDAGVVVPLVAIEARDGGHFVVGK